MIDVKISISEALLKRRRLDDLKADYEFLSSSRFYNDEEISFNFDTLCIEVSTIIYGVDFQHLSFLYISCNDNGHLLLHY